MSKDNLNPGLRQGNNSSSEPIECPSNMSNMNLRQLADHLVEDQIRRASSGRLPPFEQYLETFPQLESDHELIVDLAYNEILLLEESGHEVDIADYQIRFPEIADALANQFQLLDGMRDSFGEVQQVKSSVLSSGSDFAKRFRIDDQLGQGGFSDVYKAWDNKLKRFVAIKVARVTLEKDDSQFQRFAREAESAARLAHPGVVQVFDFGEHLSRPYIVQQLLDNGTLADRLQIATPMKDAVNWLVNVCEAIDYAHKLGVIHRDIKPSNILFDELDKPRVADFGLAWLADSNQSITQQGDVLGTPAYMSPEQVRGELEGAPSDVYSLGVILYQLLCHRLPFEGNTSNVLHKIVSSDPTPPRHHVPGIPRDLQTICLKAMEKHSYKRYQTARELADEMRRFLSDEPIRARPIGALERVNRWCRRQPSLVATLIFSFVLLVSLATLSYFRITKERDDFRAQRDLAQKGQYSSLLKAAESDIRSRRLGWYSSAIDSLHKAASPELRRGDVSRLRELLIEALGDNSPRFELVASSRQDSSAVTAITAQCRDGLMIVGNADGVVRILDDRMQSTLAQLAGPRGSISQIEVDPDFRFVWALSEGMLWTWDLGATASQGFRTSDSVVINGSIFEETPISAFDLSPDGTTLGLAYQDGDIALREVSNNGRTKSVATLRTNGEAIHCLDFNANSRLICGGSEKGVVRNWDVDSGHLVDFYRTGRSRPITTMSAEGNPIWSDSVSYRFEMFPVAEHSHVSPIFAGAVVQVLHLGRFFVVGTRDGRLHLTAFKGLSQHVITSTSGFGELTCISKSADDRFVYSGYVNGTIRKWEIATSQFVDQINSYQSLCLGPDNVLFYDATKKSISLPNSEQNMERADFVNSVCVGQKSGVLICAQGRDLVMLEPKSDVIKRNNMCHSSTIVDVAISDDESSAATADSDGSIKIWSLPEFRLIDEVSFLSGTIHEVLLVPGYLIATGTRGVTSWNLSTGKKRLICQHPQYLSSVATNGSEIVHCGPDGNIEIRKIGTWEIVKTLEGHGEQIAQLRFASPQVLVSLSYEGTLRFWDLKRGSHLRSISVSSGQDTFCLDPSRRFIVTLSTGSSDGLVWDYQSDALIGTMQYTKHCRDVAFSQDGAKLWLAASGVLEYDDEALVAARDQFQPLEGAQVEIPFEFEWAVPGSNFGFAWTYSASADGRWIATAGYDRVVRIRSQHDFRIHRFLREHVSQIWCSDFSPDSSILATGGFRDQQGEVILWDTESWQPIRRLALSSDLISSLNFHPSLDLLAVCSFDGSVNIVDCRTYETTQLLSPGVSAMDIRFGQDWLAVARTSEGITVWPVDNTTHTFGEPGNILDANQRVWTIAFSNDGQQLASATESGLINFYSIPKFERQVTLRTSTTGFRRLIFSKDDEYLAGSAYTPQGGQIWNLKKLRTRLDEVDLNW